MFRKSLIGVNGFPTVSSSNKTNQVMFGFRGAFDQHVKKYNLNQNLINLLPPSFMETENEVISFFTYNL